MRRFMMLVSLVAALVVGVVTAQAFRFPQRGPHAFNVTLPKGWVSKTDKRGGLMLIAPGERALVYLGIEVDGRFRGKPDSAVASDVAKTAGIERLEAQGAARISDAAGASLFRGTAYTGVLPAKHGLARKAKVVIIRLAADTWAQVVTVTQPGINAVENEALDRVLNGLTLISKK
jgi:hypothetical protein